MNDYCYCDSYSYPYYERPIKHAKKVHKCYDCNSKIEIGDWYMGVGGLCEGEWWNEKICSRCWSMLKWTQEHVPCVCIEYGNMRDNLIETCRSLNHEAPGLLFGLYRRMLGAKLMDCPSKVMQ